MICLQKKADCIFNKSTECEILRDTKFNRPCPFFKKGYSPVQEFTFEGRNGVFRRIPRNPKYFISEYGEVISSKGHLLAEKRDKSGLRCVVLSKVGQKSMSRVAVLLAEAFELGRDGRIEYKDGDPDNINIYNVVRIKGKGNGKK